MSSDRSDSTTRRTFLAASAATVSVGITRATSADAAHVEAARQPEDAISEQTIAEAAKLAAVDFTEEERESIARGIGRTVRGFLERRSFELPNSLAPSMAFDPRLPGVAYSVDGSFNRSSNDAGPLPSNEDDIAFAPVTSLSRWIESGQLSSERVTRIYLDRIKSIGPKLECIVTVTEELALRQAKRADAELKAGKYRGPLHGIPWGGKDLLDTKDIRTSWGAEPYKDRVADADATVVRLLDEAGAVLVAKTTLGALAYGDIWFGGRTNNPWKLDQGSSGSSAGSAAGTAAGLFGFSIGTETLGSIVSPSMRCGTTGLRPTFGRVSRAGAMSLCWSLDKIGPICRTVEDCITVLNAINGPSGGDPNDAGSIDMPLRFDAKRSVKGLRAGYDPRWLAGRRVSEHDKRCMEVASDLGIELIEVALPEDVPFGALITILNVEAASAFEELTLSGRDDALKWQEPQAWPNSFRTTRFTPAIEFVQADRIRRHTMKMMHDLFEQNRLDVMMGPSYAGSMLLITNSTGHPSVTIRSGFNDDGTPHGFTIWGKLFDEGTVANVGMAMEKMLDVWHRRPSLG